jgi:hypothetical protein
MGAAHTVNGIRMLQARAERWRIWNAVFRCRLSGAELHQHHDESSDEEHEHAIRLMRAEVQVHVQVAFAEQRAGSR